MITEAAKGPQADVTSGLALEVAGVQVSHDGIDRMPAHGDGASPRCAQGKEQGHAESDDHCEPADRERGSPAAAQGKHHGIGDQRRPGNDQDDHIKDGKLT